MAPRQRFVSPRLIGREAELDVVRAAGRDAVRRHGAVLLVAGPAGIGKSALLRRATEDLRRDGLVVVEGASGAAESARPFGPFVDVLRAARAWLTAERFDQLVNARAFELTRLLPELGVTHRATPEAGATLRILDAVEILLTDLSTRSPLAVVVDDLHWVDEASLDLFVYLGRRAARKPLLLIAAYRSDELHRGHPLVPRLMELERDRLATRVDLEPLPREGTRALVQAVLGTPHPTRPELLDLLHRRSEGNPFYIEELLKIVATTGVLADDARWNLVEAERSVPATVRATIEARVAQLPPEAQEIVRVAAAIGPVFEFSLLQAVTASAEELIGALRTSVDAQLVDEDPAGADAFRFRHALTREAILAGMLRHERATLHRRIAETLERMRLDDRAGAERLAYHFDESGDAQRAAPYHEIAAEESEKRFAFTHALPHLERVIAATTVKDAYAVELRRRIGNALFVVGRYEAAIRAYEEARAIAHEIGDVHGEGRLLQLVGAMKEQRGDASGRELLAQAIALLEPLGDSAELAMALAGRATNRAVTGRYAEAKALARPALEMAERVGATQAKMAALHATGLALGGEGSLEALPMLERALELSGMHPALAETVFHNAVVMQVMLGVPRAEQRDIRDRAHRFALRYSLPHKLRFRDLEDAFFAGRWDEALALYAETVGHEHRFAAAAELTVSCIEIARAGLDPLALLATKYSRMRPLGSPQALHAWWLAGAREDLRRESEWLHVHAEAAGGFYDRPLAGLYGLAATHDGPREERERWIERLTEAKRWPHEPIFTTAMRSVAAAERAIDEGDAAGALVQLEDAAGQLRDDELALFESVVRVRRAEVAATHGSPDVARAELNWIVDQWTRVGAAWFVAVIVKKADSWGLHIAHRSKTASRRSDRTLTDRELEVARLVADGLTNKQIAERLIVSDRTAESHVERIREKLAVHTRSQIARWVSERGSRGP